MSESKIEKFDRAACGTVGDEAMQALAEVAEKYGLTLVRERGSFDHGGGSFTFKASFKVMTESGQPAEFARQARMLGLPEDCWGAELEMGRGMCKITGLNLRARKYPVLTEMMNGDRGYSYQAGSIKRALEFEALRAEKAQSA